MAQEAPLYLFSPDVKFISIWKSLLNFCLFRFFNLDIIVRSFGPWIVQIDARFFRELPRG